MQPPEQYFWHLSPYCRFTESRWAILCMIVASLEYSVIIMVYDIKFTAAIWQMAYIKWPIETVANEAFSLVYLLVYPS